MCDVEGNEQKCCLWLRNRLGMRVMKGCWLCYAAGTGTLKPAAVPLSIENGCQRAQTWPPRHMDLSLICSDCCAAGIFFCSSILDVNPTEALGCRSGSHTACEQPASFVVALPCPLKLGGKQVTAITCFLMLFDLLLQLKLILVGEACVKLSALRIFLTWSWQALAQW